MKIKRQIKRRLPKDIRLPESTTWGRLAWYLWLVSSFFAIGVYYTLKLLDVPEVLALVGGAGLAYLLLSVFLNNLGRTPR